MASGRNVDFDRLADAGLELAACNDLHKLVLPTFAPEDRGSGKLPMGPDPERAVVRSVLFSTKELLWQT